MLKLVSIRLRFEYSFLYFVLENMRFLDLPYCIKESDDENKTYVIDIQFTLRENPGL